MVVNLICTYMYICIGLQQVIPETEERISHLYVYMYNIIFLFLFCQKVKAVDNILNYFSNSNSMVYSSLLIYF